MSSPRLVQAGLLDLFPMERSSGVHVSDPLQRILRSLDPARYTDEPPNQLRLNLGSALEHAIADALEKREPDRYVRPGELQLDGIFGTPDLIDLLDWTVCEIKLTWMSCRDADPEDVKFWRYWVQLKAYCKMANAHRGRLWVVFINGDYREREPVGIAWEQEFEQAELDENWGMLIGAVD